MSPTTDSSVQYAVSVVAEFADPEAFRHAFVDRASYAPGVEIIAMARLDGNLHGVWFRLRSNPNPVTGVRFALADAEGLVLDAAAVGRAGLVKIRRVEIEREP